METIQFPKVAETNVLFGGFLGTKHVAPQYKALVNPDTNNVYGITKKSYQLIKHEHALEMVVDSVKQVPEYGHPIFHTPNFYCDGARMKTQVSFPEVETEFLPGDKLQPQLEIYNSYDGAWKFEIIFSAMRLICTNGLRGRKQESCIIKKHTKSLNTFYIQESLKKGLEDFSEQNKIWSSWVDQQIELSKAQRYISNMTFNKTETKELIKQTEVSSGLNIKDTVAYVNLWLFYNIITQYLTHNIKSENRRRFLYQKLIETF